VEQRRRRRSPAVRLTDRDLELLAFLARHRLVHSGHVAALLGVADRRAREILRRLADGRYVRGETVFAEQRACYRIRRKGLEAVGGGLPAPGLDLRSYEHDMGLAWLWLAARGGAFGPIREALSERQLRSHDEAPERTEPPLAVRLGGFGRGGRERLHYPDLLLLRPDGRRIALELELSPKPRRRLEGILAGYGADPGIDAVLYLVPNRTIGNAVIAGASRLGLSDLVRVQLVRGEPRPGGSGCGRVRERSLSPSSPAPSRAAQGL
jgi:hypothetical protein